MYSVYFTDANTGYAVGYNGVILKTTNGGQSGINDNNIAQKSNLINYPNPFSNTTNISYQLPEKSNVNLSVFDITGKVVKTLVNQSQQAGQYNINFDAGNLQSGIYYYRLVTGNRAETGKMIIISEE